MEIVEDVSDKQVADIVLVVPQKRKKLLREKRLVNSIDNSLNPINYDIINLPQNTKGNGYIWYPMSYERHADKHFLLENRFWWYSH